MAYQYETSPRKLQPEYEPQKSLKKRKIKKSKIDKQQLEKKIKAKKRKTKVKVIFYIVVGFAVLFVMGYRNSLINESFLQIKTLKNDLAMAQKENEQLQVNIENNLNLKNVEQSAKELLGMQKLENSQKVYIDLPKQDYVEPATEEIIKEEQTSWFQKIIAFVLGK